MPDVDQSNDKVPKNTTAGEVAPEFDIGRFLQECFDLPFEFVKGAAGLLPDENLSTDKVPQTSSAGEVVPEVPFMVLDDFRNIPGAVAELLDDLTAEEGESSEPSESSPEESENRTAEENARNTETESKTGSSADASEAGKRPVEITVTINEGSVIEEGKLHFVTPGELVKFYKEVAIKDFGTKVLVDTRTGVVSTFESGSDGSMNLREHPNLVAVITEANANGKSATGLTAQSAAGLPVVSIDFGISSAERGFEGISEVREGIPRSVGLVEPKANRMESTELEKGPKSSHVGKQGPKSLGEGVAPHEGQESRSQEEKIAEEPHPAGEILAGAAAVLIVGSWVAGWYFSDQGEQAKESKNSSAGVPATGWEP